MLASRPSSARNHPFPHQRVLAGPVTKGVSFSPTTGARPHSATCSPDWCDQSCCAPMCPPPQGQRPCATPWQELLLCCQYRPSPYDSGTRPFYGDPRAYADNFPDSWEAKTFCDGRYPDPTTFISCHLAPDCHKPQPSYAQGSSATAPKR